MLNIPVFWREAISTDRHADIPSKLPMKLVVNRDWGGITLEANEVLLTTLQKIYE